MKWSAAQPHAIRPFLGVAIADFRPFLIRLLRLAVEHPDQRLSFALGCRLHGGTERLGHVGANREVNHPEAWILALPRVSSALADANETLVPTVKQQLFLIACCIRS
jgi:hypothetical protein